MKPAFLDAMSWEMAEVYGAITDQLLINLARYFPYYNAGDPLPTSAFEYQAAMLAQMGQVNAESMRIIRNGLADADDALNGILETAVADSVRKIEPDLYRAAKAGVFMMPSTPIVSPNQMRAFQLYYKQAADKLNLVNTVMLESTQSAYTQAVSDVVSEMAVAEGIGRIQTAMDTAAGEAITGVSSWNQAKAHAIDRMKENGITGFIDHAGRHWSAEAYVAMDVRTTVMNTARAAVWETNESFGNDLYSVSWHNGARPLCYDWQNKVISSIDAARTVVDLDGNEIQVFAQSATTYGQPAGLFGINCGHYPTPFIPGVSKLRGQPQNEEDNAKTYAESQQQRGLERKLREEKRDLMMMKAQGADPDVIAAQRDRCRQTSADIDQFCKETGRARHRDREGVYTKREFPEKDSYDISQFDRTQKDIIEKYYKDGGAQQEFTFGQMTPNDSTTSVVTEGAGEVQTQQKDADRQQMLEGYDKRIEELEKERYALIESGSDDYVKSDKLYSEIEDLKVKREIVANGGYTINEATVSRVENYVVAPGTSNQIDLASADVYTMPDGTQFVFKHGIAKAHQHLTPEALIDQYYQMPKEVRERGQKVINVVDRYNPDDAYWRKTYKGFTHSYATGGEQITFYRWDYEHDKDYLLFTLEHESGHLIDQTAGSGGVWFSDMQEWTDAMAKDKAVSGLDSFRSYGTNSHHEDFADSVGYYFTKHEEFARKMPNRAALIERVLGIGGAP